MPTSSPLSTLHHGRRPRDVATVQTTITKTDIAAINSGVESANVILRFQVLIDYHDPNMAYGDIRYRAEELARDLAKGISETYDPRIQQVFMEDQTTYRDGLDNIDAHDPVRGRSLRM